MRPWISTSRYVRFRLFLTVWRSVWFRYLALRAATYPKSSVLLIVAALLTIFYKRIEAGIRWLWHVPSFNPSWSSLSKAAAALFLVWLFAWAIKMRKRIFVAPFEDYSGDSTLKDFVAGLPPMLLNELSRIRQLHENAGASGAYSSGDDVIKATISVQNVGETLESAVTKESTVDLGFLHIPIGAIFGIFGRIGQGPKLSGSVHKQDNIVTLIARIDGGGFRNTDWLVDSRDLVSLDPANSTPVLTQLVEQLAYRIFTDLVPTGSRHWEAVYAFSQGLNHLRITTRTDADKSWNLRQAEARFIEAGGKDNKFGTCYYNLGVVYDSLGQRDSAARAYAEAIARAPEFAPSHYALALNCWNTATPTDRELYCHSIRYCDQAVALDPDYARAWSLKGLAYQKMKKAELPEKAELGPDVFKRSNKDRGVAAAVAWRAFCKSILAGRPDESASVKGIAVTCLRNLAVGHANLNHRRAKTLFAQALHLRPADADIRFEFGKTLFAWGELRAAVEQFATAIGTDSKPLYWAHLARAQAAAQFGIEDVKESLRHAIHDSSTEDKPDPEIRATVRKTCDEPVPNSVLAEFLGKVDMALEVAAREVGPKPAELQDPKIYLERLELNFPKDARGSWDFDSEIEAVQNRLSDDELKVLVKSAADVLVRDKGLYGTLALGFLGRDEPETALPHAERAVKLNPSRAWDRSVLGQVYWGLGDYERAEAEWRTCLDLSPSDLDTVGNVASTYWNRGVFLLQPERRREMFERVIEYFRRVLRITENQVLDSSDANIRKEQLRVRGNAHFSMGRFHQELLRYDDAAAELMKAKGLRYKPLESCFYLGETYLEAKAYDKAEDTLREGLKTVISLMVKARKENSPVTLSQPAATMLGEEIPVNELLARFYLVRALAGVGSGVNLDKAKRLGRFGDRFGSQVTASKRKELKACYHMILGSIALKFGQVDLAIEELERSIKLYLDKDCYLRLAEAHLAQARSDRANWKQWIAKARNMWQSASDADVRGRCAKDLGAIKAGIDAAEREKRVLEKPEEAAAPPNTSVLVPSQSARI